MAPPKMMHVESASQSVTIHPSPPAGVRLQAVPGNGEHQLPFPVVLSSKGKDCKGLWLLGKREEGTHSQRAFGVFSVGLLPQETVKSLHDDFFRELAVWLSRLNRRVQSTPKYF